MLVRKTVRAAQDDTVCVEWESSYRDDDDAVVRARAAELWTVRYGRIIEWHAYQHRVRDITTELLQTG
jgi:hypothetical protein